MEHQIEEGKTAQKPPFGRECMAKQKGGGEWGKRRGNAGKNPNRKERWKKSLSAKTKTASHTRARQHSQKGKRNVRRENNKSSVFQGGAVPHKAN